MNRAPETLRRQQLMLAHWIRDPERQPPPPGVEARRLQVYRRLVRGNLDSLLGGQFPVIRKLRGESFWRDLVDAFLCEHRARTPLFPEIGKEFASWLGQRAEAGRGDPPFLAELAHYEWAELGVTLSDAVENADTIDPQGDLLRQDPVLSPQAWPLAYRWPVDRIGPGYESEQPPVEPTLLLLQRRADHQVRFSRLDPMAYALLDQIRLEPAPGARIVERLATQAGVPAGPLMRPATELLQAMRERGVLLGSRRAPAARGQPAAAPAAVRAP